MDDVIEGPKGTFYHYVGIHTPIWIRLVNSFGLVLEPYHWECSHCRKRMDPVQPHFVQIDDG